MSSSSLLRSFARTTNIVRRTSMPTTSLSNIRFSPLLSRSLSTTSPSATEQQDLPPRETMEFDVVIVGAGPAGLATAIKLKQLEKEKGKSISVCVVEKASEVGAHILSGNVFNPKALAELFPDWKAQGALGDDPTPATHDEFRFLTSATGSIKVPSMFIPPALHNEGNYIISLSQLVRWLGERATELGVEIYPGFPADQVLYSEDGSKVVGVATKDAGISKQGQVKDSFTRGMELRGKQTIMAEGARGSCTLGITNKFDSYKTAIDNPSYGLGLKEVWEVPQANHKPGFIQHTAGWPMDAKTYGGSFLYHMKPNLVLVGFVVSLDYTNPYLSPYQEFQQFKLHPDIKKHLTNGSCISYGARVLNEGGYQAIPKLTFPGGLIIGCSAGLLNVAAIKGSHNAIKSGILAAETLFENLEKDEIFDFQTKMESSWVFDELKKTRNASAGFKYGLLGGTIINGITGLVTRGKEPFTLQKHGKKFKDCDSTLPAKKCKKIEYPKPDGVYTFDLLTNLQRSGTNHDEDQPSHLKIKPEMTKMAQETSFSEFAGPEARFCPAKVYEYVDDESNKVTGKRLVINKANCLHCKACSIKTPGEFINWTVPEGGGGPAYNNM